VLSYGDSEVLVGKHDEGYCAQQWNRGDGGDAQGDLYVVNWVVLGRVKATEWLKVTCPGVGCGESSR
jgi:hypothetical protein